MSHAAGEMEMAANALTESSRQRHFTHRRGERGRRAGPQQNVDTVAGPLPRNMTSLRDRRDRPADDLPLLHHRAQREQADEVSGASQDVTALSEAARTD